LVQKTTEEGELRQEDLPEADLQEAGAWHKVEVLEQKPEAPTGMVEIPQGGLPADNSTEVLLAVGIWDSEVHPLWLWELQQLGLEHAGETEGREEDHHAILVDQVSELHPKQQKVKIAVERWDY
jgi:hypothetical protein